jgi:SAM-dependent MidA family methyltransferase
VDLCDGRIAIREGPISTPELPAYFERLGVALEPGWRVEVNLRALTWMRDAARRLRRGFVILIDYGHEARELYSPAHASGTLTTFARHTMGEPGSSPGSPAWLAHPGEQDITAHVDFTSVRAAAEDEGLTTLGFMDQTYFLLALANSSNLSTPLNLRQRLALKTLLMPGGLGSTHKVLIFSKGVGAPAILGCSDMMRVT